MQEPNIENTEPTRPNREIEETVPTNIHREPTPPADDLEVTQPSQLVTPPAKMETTQPSPPVPPVKVGAAQPVQPVALPVHEDVPASFLPVPPAKPRRVHRWPWVLLGILIVIGAGVAGVYFGYQTAARIRSEKLAEKKVSIATEHFMAGLVAQQNKQYEIARTQFEYVIKMDPTFPGAQDKLREVMIDMAMATTPTPVPTVVVPTLTPTADTRPQEEIFAQVRQEYANKNWDAFFGTVDSLRRIDPSFHAVDVDGMLYFAFRFRGIDKIIHQANLEGGIYDLALSEQFGPLDVDSLGYRNWARMYLNGASFWQIDWVKVMEYFEQIYPSFPNMRDSSGMTAIERYRIAARSQGDKLSAADDPCGAYDYYQKSLQAVNDNEVATKAAQAYTRCHPPTTAPTSTPVTPTVQVVVTTPPPTAAVPTTVPSTAVPTVAPTVAPTAKP